MAKTIPAGDKVFMVSESTNTTYGGSTASKAMSEWYTMEDVSNTVRPYKVFTALLTQSGGDDNTINANYSNQEPLIIGQTYYIDNNKPLIDGGTNFASVGAPNNEIGTHFIATATIVAWGDNGGSLLANLSAPVATVLENTIGNIWFTYGSVGVYDINSNDLFTSNKTYIDTKNIFGGGQSQNIFEDMEESNTNSLRFINYYGLQSVPTAFDGIDMGRIEIRVYN